MNQSEKCYIGLTTQQAEKLLIKNGENILKGKKKRGSVGLFMGQFKDVLIIILLISTILSVFMGEIVEAIAIVLIIFINAMIGFFWEYRTEKTLEKLKDITSPTADVVRDGEIKKIPSKNIVVGDILVLKNGNKVLADAQICENFSLSCDESLLSGESVAVAKKINDEIFMGSMVVSGRGKAIVKSTGMQTQMGKIASMIDDIKEEPTQLQNKLAVLGKYIGIGCIIICSIVSIIGVIKGESILDMIITGISLAVAAVPEGLPAIITITLAIAVKRILKLNAVVKKMHIIETFGSTTVICSDKTGTLTENKMTVKEIITTCNHLYLQDELYKNDQNQTISISKNLDLSFLFDISLYCNNAQLICEEEWSKKVNESRTYQTYGDATEIALLLMGAKEKLFTHYKKYKKIDEIPFSSETKRMSVYLSDIQNQKYIFTKGAFDFLLERCNRYLGENGIQPLTQSLRKKMIEENDIMAKKSMRVLAMAYNTVQTFTQNSELELIFVGIVGMIDPPRKEAYGAISKCILAGIKPIMITGDHKLTAQAIATDLKILHEGDMVVTGKEMDAMSPMEFEEKLSKISVFARVKPEHKLKIVKALKGQGHIVTMSGDGVNDAPAIKQADIGVAMGISGSDVTKEAAQIILLDDNFSTLISSIQEGRGIYQNIRKVIRYLFSCNIGEVFTMFVGMLMGLPIILLPMQILLVNLITDSLPAICLGLEKSESETMRKKPRKANEFIFSDGLTGKIVFRGCLIGISTIFIFNLIYTQTKNIEMAQTGALFTLVMTQLIHAFECKSENKSIFSVKIFDNLPLLLSVFASAIFVILAIYLPSLQVLFKTTALSMHYIIIILGVTGIVPILSALISKLFQ